MSLWCGACRKQVEGGFGMMYRLVLDEQGNFVREDYDKGYVPPNSSVCEACWATPPSNPIESEKQARFGAMYSGGALYAYQAADSGRGDPLGRGNGAQWSSIEGHGAFVFYSLLEIERWSPKLVEVIDYDARSKLVCNREELERGRASSRRPVELYAKDPRNQDPRNQEPG